MRPSVPASQPDLSASLFLALPRHIRGRPETGDKIMAALAKAGVEFIAENYGGQG
jgi:hypothetical protein